MRFSYDLAKKETGLKLEGIIRKLQYNFRAIICKVSSFVGNPVAWRSSKKDLFQSVLDVFCQ